MLDIDRISTLDIKNLSEEETDSWCRKIFKYPIQDDLDRNELLTLFQFTRSLLNVKHIQTDVLLEELQNVEQKYEDLQNEFDQFKHQASDRAQKPDASQAHKIETLEKQLENQEKQLNLHKEQCKQLQIELQHKNQQLMEIRMQNSASDSGYEDQNSSSGSGSSRLKERNEQIEQLLDKIYDCDRINLDLAEQLAKLRVDLAKSDNEKQLLLARTEMLDKQIIELQLLNEHILNDKQRITQQLNELTKNLESRKSKDPSSQDSGTGNLIEKNYQEISNKEIQRLNALLMVKEEEIQELRKSFLTNAGSLDHNQMLDEQLHTKQDHIERLEEQLSILSESLEHQESPEIQEEQAESIQQRKFLRKIRKLKSIEQQLQLKVNELEQEAKRKDEQLMKQRKRMAMLVGGDERLGKLFEENAVLNRMIQTRDKRIEFLINQLNKHQLEPEMQDLGESSSSGSLKQEIEIRDELSSITVERDMLHRQLDAIKIHLESVHNENLELQMAMKEILDAIKQSDANTDLVLECPSLERVCRLLENRSLLLGLNSGSSGNNQADLTQMILLKSELDYIRGQNEQLRFELKHLRTDFLALIDEYTTDILNNWTIQSNANQQHNHVDTSLTEQDDDELTGSNIEDNEDNENVSSTESTTLDQDSEPKIQPEHKQKTSKSTEGRRARPRSRIQNRRPKTTKIVHKHKSCQTVLEFEAQKPEIETVDASTDPISQREVRQIQETRSTQTEIETTTQQDEESKQESNEPTPTDNSQYVLMCDEAVQATPVLHTKPTQTDQLEKIITKQAPPTSQTNQSGETVEKQASPIRQIDQSEQPIEKQAPPTSQGTNEPCSQCSKYHQMLESIKRLIEKERANFRAQDTKQTEMIDQLRNSLKLLKQEYQLDIDAKNEQIKDLRSKIQAPISPILPVPQQPQNLPLITQQEPEPELIELKEQLANRNKHIETSQNTSNNNKVIMETIVQCLQKCLQQKDEALEEYRRMLEQIRLSQQQHKLRPQISDDASLVNILNDDSHAPQLEHNHKIRPQIDTVLNNDHLVQMERIYEDLFVRPQVQENDQLMELLRSTLHQLDSVRTKSRERIKQLEMELDNKQHLLMELDCSYQKLLKQSSDHKDQLKQAQQLTKQQQDRIETLTNKLNEQIRRNQHSQQTAHALKKKVENTVFQESADLRNKINELETEVKRLELEKWNLEKRSTQERQTSKEKIAQRDQQIAQLQQQLTKLQTLLSKMEKKALSAQQNQSATKTQQQKHNKHTQTTFSMFQQQAAQLAQQAQHQEINIEIIREPPPESSPSAPQTAPSPAPTSGRESIIHTSGPVAPAQSPVSGSVPDSSREIVIDTLRRKKQSMIANEISIIANDQQQPKQSLRNDAELSCCSSTGTGDGESIVCLECQTKFSHHRIQQHLIDLRLERLLDENLRLKSQLQRQLQEREHKSRSVRKKSNGNNSTPSNS